MPEPAFSRSSAPDLPGTSLILCSRNRPDMLLDAVASILAGDQLPAELIVVDQSDQPHPTFPSEQKVGPCMVRYRWLETPGLSRASNVGIGLARHDLLVFTHDDVLVTPAWFGTLLRSLLAVGPGTVVTGRVLPEEDVQGAGGFVPSTKDDEEPRIFDRPTAEGVLYPMATAMHRSVLSAVGPFDERLGPGTPYPAAEDNDLAYRILCAGYRIAYDPAPVLYHRAWRPASGFRGLRWSYGRGQGAFYAKHLGRGDRLVLRHLLGELRYRLGKALQLALRHPRLFTGEVWYLAGLASGLGGWWLRHGTGDPERSGVAGDRHPERP